MTVPFPKNPVSSDVPLKGVNEHGGIDNNEQPQAKNDPASTASLPKGVDEHGATEDVAELGDAAKKHGVNRITGLS